MTSSVLRMGILLVDKPEGPTSHDVIDVARRGLNVRKVGHAGTLDPFASGLLVLGVGRATRLLEYFVGLDKHYEAGARLGVATDTLDPEGVPVAFDEAWRELSLDDISQAAAGLVGTLSQIPPSYSAIKVRGVPAHRRARHGEVVELEPRTVRIDELEITSFDPPDVRFGLTCSSGTYVRSVAAELGSRLGTACHLRALRRTRVGHFSVDRGVSLDGLGRAEIPERAWLTPAAALCHLPRVEVDPDEARQLAVGKVVAHGGPDHPVAAFVLADEELVAVGAVSGGALEPRKVFWDG